MNLEQTFGLTKLREPRAFRPKVAVDTRQGIELARDLFAEAEARQDPFLYHTPETWVQKWLPSKRFRLMRIALNAVALPCAPRGPELVLKKVHAREDRPIIVDQNRNQVGRTLTGFVPELIVLDGKHRFQAAQLRGDTHIWAWVGEVAAQALLDVQATGPMSAEEIKQKLGDELKRLHEQDQRDQPAPTEGAVVGSPWVSELYPHEQKAVYRHKGRSFRVGYKVDKKSRAVKLAGRPEEVEQRYMPIRAQVGLPLERAMALQGNGGSRVTDLKYVRADGTLDAESIEADFNKAVKRGYKPTMTGKAPAGCEKTVMGLKKAFGDTPKAFKIANWMHEQGRC